MPAIGGSTLEVPDVLEVREVSAPLGPQLREPDDPRTTAVFGLDRSRIQALTLSRRSSWQHRAAPLLACLIAFVLSLAGLGVILVAGQEAPAFLTATPAVTKPAQVLALVPTNDLRLGDPYHPATWESLAVCETGADWAGGGDSRSGGLAIPHDAWRSVGGVGLPHEAAPAEQVRHAIALWEQRGWTPWAACATSLGWH